MGVTNEKQLDGSRTKYLRELFLIIDDLYTLRTSA